MPHEKRTAGLETVAMPLPSKIVLSMNQHIGAPAAPVVAKGDQVYVGTVVGKAGGFVSSDIHSGVSGTVAEISTMVGSNGSTQTTVVITPDGEQKVDPSIAPPQSQTSSPSRTPSAPAVWWVWAAPVSPRR